MITSEQCNTHFTECEVMSASPEISIKRATAIMGVCHALVTLAQRLKHYNEVVREEAR